MKTKILTIILSFLILFNSVGYTLQYNVVLPTKLIKENWIQTGRVVETLYNAQEGDIVYIKLQDGSGDPFEGLKVIYALQQTKAFTIIQVYKTAKRMGAIILFYADKVLLPHNSLILYQLPHNEWGKVVQANSHFKEDRLTYEWFIEDYGSKIQTILNPVQYKQFLQGYEVYLPGNKVSSKMFSTLKEYK